VRRSRLEHHLDRSEFYKKLYNESDNDLYHTIVSCQIHIETLAEIAELSPGCTASADRAIQLAKEALIK